MKFSLKFQNFEIRNSTLVCNIEPCAYYDELNKFQNGRMDDPTDNSWSANGAVVTFQPESYHNGGFLVTGRTVRVSISALF